MMNWLINFFFSYGLSFSSSSSFFFSSISGFEIGECDDVHIKIRIHLMVNTKTIMVLTKNKVDWNGMERVIGNEVESDWKWRLFYLRLRVCSISFCCCLNKELRKKCEVSLHIKNYSITLI